MKPEFKPHNSHDYNCRNNSMWKFNALSHGLRTPREKIAFTARPKIHSHSQIFMFGQSIICLPQRPNYSDIFDLCLHWVSVVRGWPDLNVKATMADDEVNQADIDDILNSPSKPPSKPSSKPSSKPPTPPSNNGGSKPTTPPTLTEVANYEPLPGKWVNFCVQKIKEFRFVLIWFWKRVIISLISKPIEKWAKFGLHSLPNK